MTLRARRDGLVDALVQDDLRREARSPEPVSDPKENAQTNNSDQARLIGDLSHEMKTPLNAIIGFVDAMRSETYGPLGHAKYKEYADDIYASGLHLSSVISAAQDFAKVEADRYVIKREMASPADIVRDCAAIVRESAERAGLTLKVDIASGVPEAMVDARAIRQILINLLSNAVKFTKEGEIAISVEEKCGALDFTVSDTGVGMNDVVLAKLGGRYTDTHRDGVRGADGTGLGLSLCFKLARLHGGALKLNSAPGEGTTARLTVPLKENSVRDADFNQSTDIQSQLDRVNAFRRDRAVNAA